MRINSTLLCLALALCPGALMAQEASTATAPKKTAKKTARQTLIEKLTQSTMKSIVKVYGAGGIKGIPGFATGIVVDSKGMILTTWSVALRTDNLKVVDDQGQSFPAVLHRHDPVLGVALIKTKSPAKWPVLKFVDSSKVQAGQSILSFGNAFNVAVGEEKPSVAEGSISLVAPLDARIGIQRSRIRGTVFLSDAPNNPGTQGGPLVNLKGEVIGINGAVVESASTNTPLNFHIPSNNFKSFVAEGIANWNKEAKEKAAPKEKEKKQKLWLGMKVLRMYFNRPPPTYIDQIFPDSPAAKAGLRVDDLIFQLNGTTIREVEAFDRAVEEMEIGKEVVFTVKRGDKIIKCKLTPTKYVAPKKPDSGKDSKDKKDK